MSSKQKTSDFSYELPDELIAHYPSANRRDSRLLRLNQETGEISHGRFSDFIDFLRPDDLLVFNDTRVIPARLLGNKETGGKVELLLERILDSNTVLAQLKANKSPKPGDRLLFSESVSALVESKDDGFYRVAFKLDESVELFFERSGHVPLPPYIKREDQEIDRQRYQTVYNRMPGAVAAPTAGLHFDQEMLQHLEDREIHSAFITLHVGAGTFQPVRVEDLENHQMHSEVVEVTAEVVSKINRCRERKGRVIAIGTTTVRSLETAAKEGTLQPFKGETDIFIYPGFEFRVIDALLTNFHLPESTLLMLVSAFAGKEKILDAYNSAVKEKYRFFSYGDAMFIY